MIRTLILKNLILIDACEIQFGSGLTVLSGETGAGKTAIIHALSLALGKRADSQIIRQGEEKASVEAAFDIQNATHIVALLSEAGISHEPEDLLVIRREITKEGRNRSFINGQMAQLPLIQKIGSFLVHLIDQHSHHELKAQEAQREILDLFAGSHNELFSFQTVWKEAKEAEQTLRELEMRASERETRIDLASFSLKEIEDASVQEGEEERCFEEYRRLSSSQEILEKADGLYQELSEAPDAVLTNLRRSKGVLTALVKLDPAFDEALKRIEGATVEMQELAHFLSRYLSHTESDPKRLEYLEERMKILHKMKRKYPGGYSEILEKKESLQKELSVLDELNDRLDEARALLQKREEESDQLAAKLSKRRESHALTLQKELLATLRALNMPDAEFKIEVQREARSSFGDDRVTFWMKANKGEGWSPVKECASGGELARLLLAIKTTLAERNNTPTIVFDEIDANVGGETAAIIGEKFHALGKIRQVICITHFFQVACKADTHLTAKKRENRGRTVTEIEQLGPLAREKELLRMLGGKKPVFNVPG